MPLTYSTVVTRALVVGALVGVLGAVYLTAFTERTIDDAIALEGSLAAAEPAAGGHTHDEAATADGAAADGTTGEAAAVDAGHDHDDPLFTRNEQVGGGMVATLLYSVVVAAAFGTVYAAIRHRIPARSELARSAWLAAVAFGTVALVPALKYPANPPAVGDPDTVGERTVQYLSCVVLAVVIAVLLVRLSGVLRDRLDDDTRIAAVAAATVVAYGLLFVLLPATPDAIDPAVPAALIWEFRIRSLGGLALLWTGLGLGLGWALDRETARTRPAVEPTASA